MCLSLLQCKVPLQQRYSNLLILVEVTTLNSVLSTLMLAV